jgi:hypothetical protein
MSVTTSASTDAIIPELYPKSGKPRQVGRSEGFIIGAIAPALAVVFTNPFDTAK